MNNCLGQVNPIEYSIFRLQGMPPRVRQHHLADLNKVMPGKRARSFRALSFQPCVGMFRDSPYHIFLLPVLNGMGPPRSFTPARSEHQGIFPCLPGMLLITKPVGTILKRHYDIGECTISTCRHSSAFCLGSIAIAQCQKAYFGM